MQTRFIRANHPLSAFGAVRGPQQRNNNIIILAEFQGAIKIPVKMKGKRAQEGFGGVGAPKERLHTRYIQQLVTIVSARLLLCEVARLLCCNEKLNFWSSFSWCSYLGATHMEKHE